MLMSFMDESAPEPNKPSDPDSRFFVMCALLISSDVVKAISEAIENIRNENGFLKTDSFKYASYDKPPHVSSAQHKVAKESTLRALSQHGAKAIIYCALHKIIDPNGLDTYVNWGVDALLTKTQQYCNETEEGAFFAFFDRSPRESFVAFTKQKFQDRHAQAKDGFNTPSLIGTSSIWDGTSHLASACDIVTGSFTYVVNNPARDIAGKAIMKELKPLVWGKLLDGKLKVRGRGLLFRPDEIRVPVYKGFYDETLFRITEWANEI